MHMQRELHPTLLSSLEGIVDQMVWFRENWHEEVRGCDLETVVPHALWPRDGQLAAWSWCLFVELSDRVGRVNVCALVWP